MKKTIVVQYCRHLKDTSGYELTQAKNVNKNGMLFTTSCSYKRGELLDIFVKLDGLYYPIKILGSVINCEEHINGYNFGYKTSIKFVNLSNQAQGALENIENFILGEKADDRSQNRLSVKNAKRPKNIFADRAKRVNKSIMFRYRRINSNDLPILNYAINISETGVLFRTEKPYRINDMVELELNRPIFIEPITIHTKVARCTMLNQTIYDTAVKYEKISSYFQSSINDTLSNGLNDIKMVCNQRIY